MRKNRYDKDRKQRTAKTVRRLLHNSMVKEKNNEKARAIFKTPPYQKRVKQKVTADKVVNSISEVDMSELLIPNIAVYKHTEGYPDSFVARVYDVDIPTNVIMIKDTLEEIQEDIQMHTGKEFFARGKEDVPALIGAWL